MAKLVIGTLFGFTGKLGNIIGYKRNGRYFIRMCSSYDNTKVTDTQKENRLRFAMTSRFMGNIKLMLETVYCKSYREKIRSQVFTQVNKFGIVGSYPNLKYDYSAIKLFTGSSFPIESVNAKRRLNGIEFNWKNGPFAKITSTNRVIMVALHERTNHVLFGEAELKEERGFLKIDDNLKGIIHVWVGFVTKGGRHFSDCQYLEVGKKNNLFRSLWP